MDNVNENNKIDNSGGIFNNAIIEGSLIVDDINVSNDITVGNDLTVGGNFSVTGTFNTTNIVTDDLTVNEDFLVKNGGSLNTETNVPFSIDGTGQVGSITATNLNITALTIGQLNGPWSLGTGDEIDFNSGSKLELSSGAAIEFQGGSVTDHLSTSTETYNSGSTLTINTSNATIGTTGTLTSSGNIQIQDNSDLTVLGRIRLLEDGYTVSSNTIPEPTRAYIELDNGSDQTVNNMTITAFSSTVNSVVTIGVTGSGNYTITNSGNFDLTNGENCILDSSKTITVRENNGNWVEMYRSHPIMYETLRFTSGNTDIATSGIPVLFSINGSQNSFPCANRIPDIYDGWLVYNIEVHHDGRRNNTPSMTGDIIYSIFQDSTETTFTRDGGDFITCSNPADTSATSTDTYIHTLDPDITLSSGDCLFFGIDQSGSNMTAGADLGAFIYIKSQ